MKTVNNKVHTVAKAREARLNHRLMPTHPPLIDVVTPTHDQWAFWQVCHQAKVAPGRRGLDQAAPVHYPPGLNWDGILCYFAIHLARRGFTWEEAKEVIRVAITEAPILQKASRQV